MTRGARLRLCAALCVALVGCAHGAARTPPPDASAIGGLELVGQLSLPAPPESDPLAKARLGGISGLTVDRSSGEILGISDDPRENRYLIFSVARADAPFAVTLRGYVPLPSGPGAPAALDSEGIALSRSGRLFVSSEGLPQREPRIPPAIVEYSRQPSYMRNVPIPAKFLQPPSGPIDRGVRLNEGFEALTLTRDDQRLFTASETSLVQDGEGATFERGTTARILEFVQDNGNFVPAREVLYPLDTVPQTDFTPRFMINGLVELLALSDTDFISMDRGYAEEAGEQGRRATFIRIYHTSIAGATDVAQYDSIRGRSGLRPARKRLLVNLGQVPGLDPALVASSLDNFEGLAFGPTLQDGSRTLLVVSDDNFNPRQRTWFLLFRILK